MGGALTDHFGMNAAFSTMGGLNMLAFLIAAIFLPEAGQRKAAASPSPSLREMSTSNTIKGIFSFRLAFSMGRGIFAAFMPIFAGTYIGLSPTFIGVLLAVNILLMSLLQIYGGHTADRFSRRAMVTIGGMINLAFLALIPSGGNFWQLLGICALGSLGGAISIPAASALVVEEGRRFGMGSAMAVFALAFSIGMAVGPLLSGVIADLVNINSVFYFGAIMSLIGTGLFIRFTK